MKYAITCLLATLSLSGCAGAISSGPFSFIAPDVKKYPQGVLNAAADEIDGGKCPILSTVMLPDYQVCRDQSRVIR